MGHVIEIVTIVWLYEHIWTSLYSFVGISWEYHMNYAYNGHNHHDWIAISCAYQWFLVGLNRDMSFFLGKNKNHPRMVSIIVPVFFSNITDSARNIVRFCWDDHGIYFMAYTNHKVVFVVFIMSNGLFQFPIVFLIYIFLSIPYFMIFHELCFMFFFSAFVWNGSHSHYKHNGRHLGVSENARFFTT